MRTKRICSLENCGRPHKGRGYCDPHLQRHKNGKSLEAPIRSKNRNFGTNPTDWFRDKNGYVARYVPDATKSWRYRTEMQHRVIMEQHLGRRLVKGENVHHKNGVRHDNRTENLELWSTAQPAGQRPEDKVQYALEILRLYSPEHLTHTSRKG